MSSIWTRTTKASPGLDCGLCGFPKCSSFARAALVEDVSLDKCPLYSLTEFAGLLSEMENLVQRKTGLKFRTAAELPEGGVLLTRPCKDTDEKVMAELRVHNGVPAGDQLRFGVFDSNLLCEFSECLSDIFDVVKCSRDLGYGRADTGEMSITLLQDGRVNMRRVDDRERVLRVFAKIESAILGSIICNCCGNDLISLVSGLVDSSDSHPALRSGSSICIDKETLHHQLSKRLFLNEFDAPYISDAIDNGFSQLETSIASLIQGNSVDTKTNEQIDNLNCKIISLTRKDNNEVRETIILKALGLVWVLSSAFQAISMIEGILRPYKAEFHSKAYDIIQSVLDGGDSMKFPEENEQLFQVYAHSKLLERAYRKKKEWDMG
ncbi:MAG: (Fe-S)-binding protein [Candidatus Thorarchaeota archaeon]